MKEFEAKTLFEESARRVDAAAAQRLRAGRREALAGRRADPPRHWAPALALAASVLLGLAWWWPQRVPAPASVPATPVAASATAVADGAELAAVDEDAELYAWLAEAPVASEADGREQAL